RGEEALPWFDRGVAIFGELGARWELADARAARGVAKRNLGRLDEAEEDLRAAIRIAEEMGDRQLPPWTWRNLAQVAELRGDKAAAEELLKRSEDAESRRSPRAVPDRAERSRRGVWTHSGSRARCCRGRKC